MATAYDGNCSKSHLPTSDLPISLIIRTPSRFRSDLLPVSPMTRMLPISSSKPRPSASSPVFETAIVSTSTPTWHLLSPSSPEPASTFDQIRCFLAARSDAPASSKYTTATQKFHNVSMTSNQAIMHEMFPGDDAHPQHARINYFSDRRLMIITLPGLPHELMATFDNDMRESLMLQGFLWPSWKSQWLKSCGTARISLVHGRTRREMEPDGGLQILSQKLPFLLVEVADSQEYTEVLEKASWMLRHSKGKIRFAILIKLVRMTVKETRNNKRRSPDVDFSPRPITKRVRTVLAGDVDFEGAVTQDSIDGGADDDVDFECSDLSSVASNDSIDCSVLETHAIVDADTQSTDSVPVDEAPSSSFDLSSVDSNDSINRSILETHAIDDVETKSTTPISNHDVSSPLSSVDSNDSINSPPGSLNILPAATGSDVESEDPSIAVPPLVEPLATSSPSNAPSSEGNPRAAFSSAFVTVLSSSLLTGARREVNALLNCIEFWPRRPGPEDVFTFGWEDMPGLRYPDVMRGKRFTIGFEDLHDTLEVFVRTTDPDWVCGNEEHLMGEWSDEGDSGETKESEEEDEQEADGSESDR